MNTNASRTPSGVSVVVVAASAPARVPRVLDFALSDDVANNYLERGARRALVGLFGEGCCNSEFAALP